MAVQRVLFKNMSTMICIDSFSLLTALKILSFAKKAQSWIYHDFRLSRLNF